MLLQDFDARRALGVFGMSRSWVGWYLDDCTLVVGRTWHRSLVSGAAYLGSAQYETCQHPEQSAMNAMSQKAG